jgi:plastocyanin
MHSTIDVDRAAVRRSSVMRRAAAAFAAVALLAGLGACGDDDDDASSDGESTDQGTGGSADATLEVDSLSYSDVSAPAEGTLEIDNTSGAAHTFTADDGSFDVDYGPDETVDVDVPSEAGEYPFHCEIHSNMQATLTVT